MEKSKGSPSSQFAECVAMITAKHGEKENAMPASWAVPVSFSPKLVAVNISPERFTHDMVKESGRFGVCLLAEDQAELSKYAGSCSGRDTDKFENIPSFRGDAGLPLVEGAAACMECRVADAVKEGDHTVFTGQVLNLYTDESKKPLLLFRGEYRKLGEFLGEH